MNGSEPPVIASARALGWRVMRITLAVAACAAWAASDAHSQTTHLIEPISIADIHPCTGESIFLVGQIRWVFHEMSDAAGGTLLTTKSNAHAFGSGTDGSTYQFADVSRSVIRMSGSGTLVEDLVLNHHVIGRGGAPDFRLRSRFHLTVNANGEVTVIFDESESSCT